MSKFCYIDFETRSEADLKKCGSALYAQHPSTDIICVGAALEDEKVTLWYPGGQLHSWLMDKDIIFVAHNMFFDRMIWNNVLVKKYKFPELPIERTKCTMAKCYAHGLSGSLKEAAIALNLPIKKDMEGRDNMLSLSKPRKNGTFWTPADKPDSFNKLYEYCKTDVEVMRLIDETLPDLAPKEQRIWFIDQRINHEGIKVDIEVIKTAVKVGAIYDEQKQSTLKEITGGMPDNSRRRALLLTWLNKQGVSLGDTRKSTLEEYLQKEEGITDKVKIVLQTCISGGKTSLAKYSKMLERCDENGSIRELLQYHGAHTGRWAGRGVQIQNFPRPATNSDTSIDVLSYGDGELFSMFYKDCSTALSSMLRKVIIAPEGATFYGADFSQIEARVLAWLAGQKSKLEAYERGEDLYCKAATEIFGATVSKEDKEKRQVGKVADLALGFGGGIGALVTMSTAYNVDLSPIYPSIWKKANPYEKQQAEISYDRYLQNGNSISKEVGALQQI